MNFSKESAMKSKIIADCIHGHIKLPAVCVRIIDTKQFQRLRDLKQLGNVYRVFPNATHNRFQHSIGVGHLAEKFGTFLVEKYPQWIDKKDVLCLMIAGLCHDLGHGPFSHTWETFIKEAEPQSSYHHEDTSIKMFEHLLEDNQLRPVLMEMADISEKDILFIKELIVGVIDKDTGLPRQEKYSQDETWPYLGRGEEKSFLYEIVANKINGIDVDKWDYFLRDDYYLKIGHVFQHSWLIDNCQVLEIGPNKRKRICFRDNVEEKILEIYQDRARLHRHGYQHRVALIAERMTLDAWLLANKFLTITSGNDATEKYSLSQASQKDVSAHMKLTEEYIRFRIQDSNHPDAEAARNILDRIDTRDLYKDICSIEIPDTKEGQDLKKMSNQNLLEDIWTFFEAGTTGGAGHMDGPKAGGSGHNDGLKTGGSGHIDDLSPQDFTVLRQSISAGTKFEEIYLYNKAGAVSKADSSSLQKRLQGMTSTKIFVCSKKKVNEDKADIKEAVKKWAQARGMGKYSE